MLLRRFHRGMHFQTLERMLHHCMHRGHNHVDSETRKEKRKKSRTAFIFNLIGMNSVLTEWEHILPVSGYLTWMLRNLFTYLS